MNLAELFIKISADYQGAVAGIQQVSAQAGQMASNVGSSLSNVGETLGTLGKAFLPISAAAGAVFLPAVKGASDYQKAIGKVATLVDTAEMPVDKLRQMFLDLSNETNRSATELAEAGYQALSAGVDYEHLGSFVKTATNLSKVGFTESSTAVDLLTTAINAYGLSAEDADRISNQLVLTQNKGKTTVDELGQYMGRAIPTANSMGVSIDQLCAAYAVMTKQGTNTRIATTQLTAMMGELGDSGSQVSSILQQKTGMSFQELMASGMSLGDVIGILEESAAETGTNFNELWGSSEAGKGALLFLSEEGKKYNDVLDEMQNTGDLVGEGLDKMATPAGRVSKAFNRIKNSGIEMGLAFLDTIAPAAEKFGEIVEKLTKAFNGLPAPVKVVIASVLGIVTAIAPVLLAIGKFLTWLPMLGSAISLIGGLITPLIGGISALFTLLMANPIMLVVAALGAFVAFLIHAWNTNEQFRASVIQVWENIKLGVSSAINAVVGFLQGMYIWITTTWASISATTSMVWNSICTFIVTVWNTIKTFITNTINYIQLIIQTVMTTINIIITTIWNAIRTTVDTVVRSIKNVITTVWNAIKSTTSNVFNSIKSTITSIWNGIKSTVSNVVNGIKSTISNGFNAAKSTVDSIFNGIKNSISDKINAAKDAVSGAITAMKNFFSGLSFELPHIKVPHFNINGGSVPWGIGGKGSPPSVSIDWYAKAMRDGMILTKPTIFGINPQSGALMGGGEAGSETVVGTNSLMSMISAASHDSESIALLSGILNRLSYDEMKKVVTEAIIDGDFKVELNSREVGRIVRSYAG